MVQPTLKEDNNNNNDDHELSELQKKVKDLEDELGLPDADFEKKLTERLHDEIKANKAKLDSDYKRELHEEKKRIVT